MSMAVAYPNLIGEIAKRGMKKNAIAKHLEISDRALYNKLAGEADFTWPEVLAVHTRFFPDIAPTTLFARAGQDTAQGVSC